MGSDWTIDAGPETVPCGVQIVFIVHESVTGGRLPANWYMNVEIARYLEAITTNPNENANEGRDISAVRAGQVVFFETDSELACLSAN